MLGFWASFWATSIAIGIAVWLLGAVRVLRGIIDNWPDIRGRDRLIMPLAAMVWPVTLVVAYTFIVVTTKADEKRAGTNRYATADYATLTPDPTTTPEKRAGNNDDTNRP